MAEIMPLFPLGTVLFPGLLLPLHIFEDRYRRLVHDLADGDGPGRFGVIAIREGRETGARGVRALHEIGCTATLRRVTPHADGRFDITAVGGQRFRILRLDATGPYLRGEVEPLAEETGEESAADAAAAAVRTAFRGYLDALTKRGSAPVAVPGLPADPVLLSYLVAAAMTIEVAARQALLAAPDAVSRLTQERSLLASEIAMLRSVSARPAPDLGQAPYSAN